MRNLRKISSIAAIIILIILLKGQSQTIKQTHQTPILELASYTNTKTSLPNPVLGTANVAIGGGGYVTGIYPHPKKRDLVYIKTDIGGFYRWNSTKQSWIPLTDHFPLAQLNYYGGEAIALDPKDLNTLYIAVGKYTSDWWEHKGTIFKSTNQGQTWKKLNIDLKMGGNESQRWTGERLAINPFDSEMILFGSRKDGLWKSSDAGKTWGQVKAFPGKLKDNFGITAIVFNKDVLYEVYAVVYDDGIYQSNDNGATWNKLSDNLNPNSLSQTNRLVVASNKVLYVTHSKGVSKYSRGQWSNITPFNNQIAFNAISVNPLNPDDILVCTLTEKSLQIYRSLNGGDSWKLQNRKTVSSVHWWSDYMTSNPSVAAIEFDANVPQRVWMTDWYGVWRTDNIDSNQVIWKNYQQGHEEVVTFDLVSPPTGAPLLSGLSDVEGFYHEKLDAYPSRMLGGKNSFQDTYSIAYSETNPKRMVRVGGNRFNNTYGGATSNDGGKNWRPFASFPSNTMPTRVAISATNPDLFVVTVSNGQALRTTDGGATWQKSGLPDGFTGPWNWSQPLAADKVDGNTFYYYANSKLYRSTNGGASFEFVSLSIPHADWNSLITTPGVKGELWLSLDKQGLYRSRDGGKTFSRIPGVERAYLFSIGLPQSGSKIPTLYVYGSVEKLGNGIFRSVDRGRTWKRIGDSTKTVGNDPNVMEASRQKFGLVFIGTNGRGIYYGS